MARSEFFIRPPHSAHVGFGQRKPTMMDRQLAQMRMMREEEDARIRTQDELKRELFDFTHVMETDEYGFPYHTKYQISDNVPDVYVPSEKGEEKGTEKEVVPSSSGDPQPEV